MEGKQGSVTTIVIGLFALLQVCLVAAFSQGWHPWESKADRDAAKNTLGASLSTSVEEIVVPYADVGHPVLSDIVCLSEVSSVLVNEGFTDIMRNDDNGYVTAMLGNKSLFLKCYVAQNLIGGALTFPSEDKNVGKASAEAVESKIRDRIPGALK